MIDLVYYTDAIRCYRNGVVERFFRNKYWRVVKNTANNGDGYNTININGKMILRQRLLAYCFLGLDDIVGTKTGECVIDHKSGDTLDNSLANLRITTQQGNNQNQTTAKGYYWNKRDKKWNARIGLNGKHIHLGYYTTEAEARQAYLIAKEKYHIA
jgi:hypothetical protein